MLMPVSMCFRFSCLYLLDELTDGVWVEVVQAQPNARPPFFSFFRGNIVSPSAQAVQGEYTFPPQVNEHGGGVGYSWASSRSFLPFFSFPFSPLIVLG